MDLSRKILMASCVCAAFLAVGTSCMVEDRNIEDKGVFVCVQNSDCLEGSICDCVKDQAAKEACAGSEDADCAWNTFKSSSAKCDIAADGLTQLEGTCARIDDINHCQDKDGDGFMSPVSSNFSHECGFNDKNPQDNDDNDKLSYPGADEVCDGKDNDGDGCIDGTCMELDENGNPTCTTEDSDTAKCQRIAYACLGSLKIYDSRIEDTVCSAKKIGANVCLNGNLVYATTTDNIHFEEVSDKSCAEYTDNDAWKLENHFVESEFKYTKPGDKQEFMTDADGQLVNFCDDADNDCNGKVDEGCTECKEPETTVYCVTVATMNSGNGYTYEYTAAQLASSVYNDYKTKCENDNVACKCLGTIKCHENSLHCVNAFGDVLSKNGAITDLAAKNSEDTGWSCANYGEM